jgi:hypothetical protein
MSVVHDDPNDKMWARHFDGHHKHPAIALCIAALRAQEASNPPPPLIAFKLQASGEPVMTIHADGRVTLNEDAQPTQTDALREKINDIKEAWDWWQVDTYDRCASVVEDAINAALKESK